MGSRGPPRRTHILYVDLNTISSPQNDHIYPRSLGYVVCMLDSMQLHLVYVRAPYTCQKCYI